MLVGLSASGARGSKWKADKLMCGNGLSILKNINDGFGAFEINYFAFSSSQVLNMADAAKLANLPTIHFNTTMPLT